MNKERDKKQDIEEDKKDIRNKTLRKTRET